MCLPFLVTGVHECGLVFIMKSCLKKLLYSFKSSLKVLLADTCQPEACQHNY